MRKSISLSFVATTGLLLGALVLGGMTERRIPESLALPLDKIDPHLTGWTESGHRELDPRTLKALDPTSYLSRTYRKGAWQLDLFVAYYAQQRAGESMHSPKHCLPGSGWEIMRRGSITVPVMGNRTEINQFVIENLGTKMVMLYWYQSPGRIVASEYRAKLLLARDTAFTGHTGGSIVRILLPDDTAAINAGSAFASDLIPEVQRCLGSERSGAKS